VWSAGKTGLKRVFSRFFGCVSCVGTDTITKRRFAAFLLVLLGLAYGATANAALPPNVTIDCPGTSPVTASSAIKKIDVNTLAGNTQSLFDQFSDENGGELVFGFDLLCVMAYQPAHPGDHAEFTNKAVYLNITLPASTYSGTTVPHLGHAHSVYKIQSNGLDNKVGYIVTLTTDSERRFPNNDIYLPVNVDTPLFQIWRLDAETGSEGVDIRIDLFMHVRLVSLDGLPLSSIPGIGAQIQIPLPGISWFVTSTLVHHSGMFPPPEPYISSISSPVFLSGSYEVSKELDFSCRVKTPSVVSLGAASVTSFPVAGGPSPEGITDFGISLAGCAGVQGGFPPVWRVYPLGGRSLYDSFAHGLLLPFPITPASAKGVAIQILRKIPNTNSFTPLQLYQPYPLLDYISAQGDGTFAGGVDFRLRYYRLPASFIHQVLAPQAIQPGNVQTGIRFLIEYK